MAGRDEQDFNRSGLAVCRDRVWIIYTRTHVPIFRGCCFFFHSPRSRTRRFLSVVCRVGFGIRGDGEVVSLWGLSVLERSRITSSWESDDDVSQCWFTY